MFAGFFGTCTPQACSGCIGEGLQRAPREEQTLHPESKVPAPRPPQKARSNAIRLSVPPVFARFQFSAIYTQLGATQGTLMEQQKAMLQAILKHFTKDLTGGVVLSVLDPDGRVVDHFCRLDPDMTQLTMQTEGSCGVRALIFRDIERVCSPEEVRNLRTSKPLFCDECCTTVVLSGQCFVTFRLESVEAREYLMLCLQVLRMSQDQPRMWYT